MTSQNSLFRQVGLVLALYSEADKTLQLAGLNSLNLESLVLDALAHLAAFLEVVESGLLGRLRVHTDLVPEQNISAHIRGTQELERVHKRSFKNRQIVC